MASAIKLSYHQRLFLLLFTFLWSSVVCFAIFQYLREKEYKFELLSTQLQLYNRHLLELIEEGEDYEVYITTHAPPFDDLRISIITFTGAVIYDNTLPQEALDNHGNRPEIVDALEKGSGYHIGRQSISDGRQYFYSASKGARVLVRTAIPYTSPLKVLLQPDRAFLWVMFAISLALSILAYFVTQRLGETIARLNRFAYKAQNGEAFDEAEAFPTDELGSISKHIVQLYAQWQQTIADRDRAYQATLHEEQEKIRIKKELTNNINHELKTPVAAMQVCLETLLSDIRLSEEKREELIERCYANNDRLRHLLNDVSLITRMEDGGQRIDREPLCLNDILTEIHEDVAIDLQQKQMQWHMHFNEKVSLCGNHALISSIFRNLTENAIAYSSGHNIYITLTKNDHHQCNIRFEDDGCGVEASHLPHLFERFYRIDKGRSRQLGGTGLGLAIVKHAVLFHGGSIAVNNRPGGGLQFDFTLRKQPNN